MNKDLLSKSFLHALGVLVYTSLIAWLLYSGESFFGKAQNFWMPAALLMLFVLSAAIVGLLVFGRPTYMYFNGDKKEAGEMLAYTLSWVFVFTVGLLILNILI